MKRSLFIFGFLHDADVEWIASIAQPRSFTAGEVMIREGEPSETLMVLTDGAADVAVGGRVLAEVTSGDVLGEVSLFDSRPPSATVTAVAPTTALCLPFETLRARLAADPEFASRLYFSLGALLSQRLRETLGSEVEDSDGIDPAVIEHVALAGRRLEVFRARAAGVAGAPPSEG
ncbi:MAG: cyclic nucleotide-binding domain-containing protein [Pseudomonadota bacterium]